METVFTRAENARRLRAAVRRAAPRAAAHHTHEKGKGSRKGKCIPWNGERAR